MNGWYYHDQTYRMRDTTNKPYSFKLPDDKWCIPLLISMHIAPECRKWMSTSEPRNFFRKT